MAIALVILVQDHGKIHYYSAKWLILYGILGVPLGILVLLYGNEVFIKVALGILIILYSLYSLFAKSDKVVKEENKPWLFVCGFFSGVLGGAYGLNGPPLVVYGNLRQWNAKQFRATLQAYFFPVSLISVLGYATKGLVTIEVGNYFMFSLITTVPAIFLGRYLNHRLKDDSFYGYVYWGLLVISAILIVSALS